PEGAQHADWEQFAADLAQLGGRTSMALPPGYDLKFAEAGANVFATFERQIAWADTAIAIVLNRQNLTTEGQGGSRAAADVHKAVQNELIRADAETASTALHDQALTYWAEFNFGDPALAPWPRWDTTPPVDKTALATTLKTLGDAVGAFRQAGA